MGKIYSGDGWIIKVHCDDHPPIHAHVMHADGKASVAIDGSVINSGVPAKVMAEATRWILDNPAVVEAEWTKMNDPRKR
ncbi:MAG: hypothetical protein BWK72_04210 [Rhodoferax ferrireducens]|uniref:DUF4160 domain-containing protein n=1 Tax=Rhodoferax ferrireducens TaxID=192843 RepID=A0A1W9KWY2_9BURK|nr:MAG: hypothetical protein BWK72_04210 [Rhodoferax ferrireducens]